MQLVAHLPVCVFRMANPRPARRSLAARGDVDPVARSPSAIFVFETAEGYDAARAEILSDQKWEEKPRACASLSSRTPARGGCAGGGAVNCRSLQARAARSERTAAAMIARLSLRSRALDSALLASAADRTALRIPRTR